MARKEYELDTILKRHEEVLRSKIKAEIINVYTNAVLEIETKNKGRESLIVRIDYFTRSIFKFMFSKLHKGDRFAVNKLVDELLNMSTEV